MAKRAAEMEKASNGTCSISPSTIGSTDSYGIKALMDIKPGETMMQETTVVDAIGDYSDRCTVCCVVVVAPNWMLLKCCKLRVCSTQCAKLASRHYHKATCGSRTVSRWSAPASSTAPTYAARERLMQKFFAILVQDQQSSLLNPIVNQLMAPYSDTQTVGFNFKIDIVTRFELLQTLGVDIFANHEYDTWVFHTIAARIQNNAHHGASVEPHQLLALHPLYSIFNHSCARNAFWEPRDDQVNSLFVTATKNIKGEEIFISYHGVDDL